MEMVCVGKGGLECGEDTVINIARAPESHRTIPIFPYSLWGFASVKMIKKYNLGDTNKLYWTLLEGDFVHMENCKVRKKVGRFYRGKNKEYKREK